MNCIVLHRHYFMSIQQFMLVNTILSLLCGGSFWVNAHRFLFRLIGRDNTCKSWEWYSYNGTVIFTPLVITEQRRTPRGPDLVNSLPFLHRVLVSETLARGPELVSYWNTAKRPTSYWGKEERPSTTERKKRIEEEKQSSSQCLVIKTTDTACHVFVQEHWCVYAWCTFPLSS